MFTVIALWSVSLLQNTHFSITGGSVGRKSGMPSYTKTTELVTIDPPSVQAGPQLPLEFLWHCSVLIDNVVYLIGGHKTWKTVLAIDVKTSQMTFKSELNNGRLFHACAIITVPKPKIVVVGGQHAYRSTEIYDIENNSWEIGKFQLPQDS